MSNSPLRNNAHASANSIRKPFSTREVGGGVLGSENRKVHRISSSPCHCTLSINLHFKPWVTQTPANCRERCPVGLRDSEIYISNTHLYKCQESTPHTAKCNSITPYVSLLDGDLCPQLNNCWKLHMKHKH